MSIVIRDESWVNLANALIGKSAKRIKKRLAAQEFLREQQKKDGTYQVQVGVANTISAFKTLEEERQGHEEAWIH